MVKNYIQLNEIKIIIIIFQKKMEENGINNNDINSKLDKILKKCELLEKQNRQNVKKYECIIDNLNTQIKFLRVEFKEKLEKITNFFGQIMQPILPKDENIIENSALLMKDKDDDKMNLKNQNEAVKKKFGEKIFDFLSKKKSEKKEELKDKEKKDNKKEKKNEENEQKNEIVEYKGKNLVEQLESKLTSILFDQKSTIDINEINELKKISSSIIIKGGGPLEMINKFFDENFNKSYYEMDQKIKDNLAYKKCLIFNGLQELSLLNKKIETKDIEQYMKEFREKFGITEKDYSDKDLKKLVSKKNYEDKTIITEILKKLKYIK